MGGSRSGGGSGPEPPRRDPGSVARGADLGCPRHGPQLPHVRQQLAVEVGSIPRREDLVPSSGPPVVEVPPGGCATRLRPRVRPQEIAVKRLVGQLDHVPAQLREYRDAERRILQDQGRYVVEAPALRDVRAHARITSTPAARIRSTCAGSAPASVTSVFTALIGMIGVNPDWPSFEASATTTTRRARAAIIAPTSATSTWGVVSPSSVVSPSQPRNTMSAESSRMPATAWGPTTAR